MCLVESKIYHLTRYNFIRQIGRKKEKETKTITLITQRCQLAYGIMNKQTKVYVQTEFSESINFRKNLTFFALAVLLLTYQTLHDIQPADENGSNRRTAAAGE